MEEWIKIPDYPNYSVSNYGNIKSDRFNRILKPCKQKNGYLRVCLCSNEVKPHLIHRLVAITFLGDGIVDHIDRDKTNNHISNLRLCSHSENLRNRSKFKNCSSRFKGVCFDVNKWRADCSIHGKRKYLGHYNTEEEAGRAYDTFCKENNLSTAVLNF